jgi:RNA-binding protein YhbY
MKNKNRYFVTFATTIPNSFGVAYRTREIFVENIERWVEVTRQELAMHSPWTILANVQTEADHVASEVRVASLEAASREKRAACEKLIAQCKEAGVSVAGKTAKLFQRGVESPFGQKLQASVKAKLSPA